MPENNEAMPPSASEQEAIDKLNEQIKTLDQAATDQGDGSGAAIESPADETAGAPV